MDCSPPGSSVYGDSLGKDTGVGYMPSSRGSSQPRITPRSPALQVDSLPSKPPGKPKNTGVGNLSLLQGIFLTQESNWGLLHCSQTLYQLSYQGTLQYFVTCKSYRLCEFLSPALEAAKHLGRIRFPERRHSGAPVEGNTNVHIISAYFKNS